MRNLILSTLWTIALLIYPLSLSSQNSFSLSLDANNAAGNQAVTSLSTSPHQVVSIQVFGREIQNANGFGIRFEYDASQVVYEGFDAGNVLPGTPHVLPDHGTNPTFVEIAIASLGGQAAVSSGLVGTIRFRTTVAFSGTAIRLVQAQLSRGGQFETATLTARVVLQSGSVARSSDFNGDGKVNVADFLLFTNHYGSRQGDGTYQAQYDLDSNGVIGVSDFLIFANNFGKEEPSSNGGGVVVEGGNAFDRTVAQIQTLETDLEQNRKHFEQEITELRENHPLNAPKDQFESDADYAARQSQLDSILTQSRQELRERYRLAETQTQIAQLYRRTFPTNDITVTLGTYNANAEYFPITFEVTLNGESQRYNRILPINKDDAQSLYNNWDKVIAKGYLSIDPGYRQTLAWIKLKYTPIWPREFWLALNEVYHLGDRNDAVAFSPDGKYIATASYDSRMATIWDLSNGQKIRQIEHGTNSSDYVYAVAFSPDGRYLATGGSDYDRSFVSGKTVLWDMNSGRKVRQIEQNYEVEIVAFSPDGKYIATLTEPSFVRGETDIWDMNSGRWIRDMRYNIDSNTIHTVAFSPDGKYLATGNSRRNFLLLDRATIWDVSNGKVVQQIEHTGEVTAVAFSPDGKYLATGGYLRRGYNRGVVIFWEVTDAQLQEVGQSILQTEHENHIHAITFSPDGKYLAVGEYGRTITLYRVPAGEVTFTTKIAIEKTIQASGEVVFLVWSPDGRFISDGKKVYRVLPQPDIQEVSDGEGQNSGGSSVTMGQPNRPPVLASIGDQRVEEKTTLTIGLTASDVDGDTLTYQVNGVNGASLESSLSGQTFRWTPARGEAGTYQVTFTVSDGRGGADSETVTIKVDVGAGSVGDERVFTLSGDVEMSFVWIEPGTFKMGSPSLEFWHSGDYERPVHEVRISRGFWLGKYEVTQKQWEDVMGTRPWVGEKYVRSGSDYPAMYISWEDAQVLIGLLNASAGSEMYRLPTEAEWEYACRTGTDTPWSFGDDERQLTNYAWYRANTFDVGREYAHAVGSKRANPWGLHDMHGNVSEWVHDWYDEDYYSVSPSVDPTGPSMGSLGSYRVRRGGDYFDEAGHTRSAFRTFDSPSSPTNPVGFRLLRQVN